MKLIIKTSKTDADIFDYRLFQFAIPNHMDKSEQGLIDIVNWLSPKLPLEHDIVTHLLYGDELPCIEERKQFDQFGEVVNPPQELVL